MEEVNALIYGNAMQFKFQPIVSAVDGSIFGYEALIRSNVPGLESPWDIINLAAENSMLDQLETKIKLHLLEEYKQKSERFKGRCLFINAIAESAIDEESYDLMRENYEEILPRVIIEISEREKRSTDMIESKGKFIRKQGGKVAIDNYGAGFHSKETIFSFQPDYIKIDVCIISRLDQDEECVDFLRDFIAEAHSRNIKVIALGIERSTQLELAVQLGVDYMQGFYIMHPEFEIKEDMDDNLKKQILEIHDQKK